METKENYKGWKIIYKKFSKNVRALALYNKKLYFTASFPTKTEASKYIKISINSVKFLGKNWQNRIKPLSKKGWMARW